MLINTEQQLLGRAAEIFFAFQSPTFPLLPCFGTKTPQTAELQSIYNCSIMEDTATCERPGTQHMNANKPFSDTENEGRGKAKLCFCLRIQFDEYVASSHHISAASLL